MMKLKHRKRYENKPSQESTKVENENPHSWAYYYTEACNRLQQEERESESQRIYQEYSRWFHSRGTATGRTYGFVRGNIREVNE